MVREKRVPNGEWKFHVQLYSGDQLLHEADLRITDAQRQNIGFLLQTYCVEQGIKYTPRRQPRRK